jgi:hypothetical protein
MMGAFNVSTADSAQALTPPSAGITDPLIVPPLKGRKANDPAMITAIAANRNRVMYIT